MKAKVKRTNDELLQTIQIKSIEKESLDRVFDQLTILEQEVSSDDDSIEKQYLKNISEKANQKKMKLKLNDSTISKVSQKTKESK
jgi:DnaJ-domain-containing protein 1